LLEATRSGEIPSVAIKSAAQQTLIALHRSRDQWMTTRTARINTLRGILREQGVLLPAGAGRALRAIPLILEDSETPLANPLRRIIALLYQEVRQLEASIGALERELRALADADPVATRLREIPGIGLLTGTALVGTAGHIHAFRRARQFGSWLGLTPREYSSGTHRMLGGISKRGDVYLRCLLTHGARAVLRSAQRHATPLTRLHQWALSVQARRGHNKAAIAVANKLGRIVWAVWARDTVFDPKPAIPEAA
jgi:transposase